MHSPKWHFTEQLKTEVEQVQPLLTGFFKAIENDPRIGVSHISLYCALLKNYAECQENIPLFIVKAELMLLAKISGRATYHKCINDLHSFGYISYQPSYNFRKKSKVFFRVKPE